MYKNTTRVFFSTPSSLATSPLLIYCVFFVDFLSVGSLYIHRAQKPTKPVTVAVIPAIHGQAPEMT